MGTFSSNLLLSLLAVGESNANGFSTWGDSANSNFEFLEDAVSEVSTVSVTSSNVTLTDAQLRSVYLKFSGMLTGNRDVLFAARKGFWFVYNGCSGSYTLTCKVSGQTGIVVPAGEYMVLYCDGTDVREILGNLFRRQNILGTVSQSSGTPTGALVEVGTASSGRIRWEKHASGLYILTYRGFQMNQATASRVSGELTFTGYGGDFVNTNYVVNATLTTPNAADAQTLFASDADCGPAVVLSPSVGAKTVSSCSIGVYKSSGGTDFGSNDKLYVDVCVTGRWF